MSVCKENANQVRAIERKIAKYIFKTYIKGKNLNEGNNGEKRDNDKNKETLTITVSEKEFMSKIFFKSRGLITQTDYLTEELNNIAKADEEYLNYPEKYENRKKTVYGYPDDLRCQHIIYNRHKFTRCNNKVDEENGGDVFCLQHWDSENPYETNYKDLVDKLNNGAINNVERR